MSDKFLNSMHKIGGILNWKISNFRSVGSGLFSQEIELAPLTIICGENSSGKSTLLHSILLTQQILNDSWQSQVQDGEVIDLNGRYVQLGEFKSLVKLVLSECHHCENIEAALDKKVEGKLVRDIITEKISTIGENISLRRIEKLKSKKF